MTLGQRPEADLHCHTTASDGQYSPREVVRLAAVSGLDIIGITDHDTIQGWEEAERAGREFGIGILRGLELSTVIANQQQTVPKVATDYLTDKSRKVSPIRSSSFEPRASSEVHILGYEFRLDSLLTDKLAEMRSARQGRVRTIIERLADVGIQLSAADVLKFAQGESVGRPHVARVMIEHGFVKDMQEAFERYIGPGAPAYVPRFKLAPAEAIRLIRDSGGVAVLAHPGLNVTAGQLDGLCKLGLQGIEVSHSEHTPEAEDHWRSLARQHGLLMTGGSDFHGEAIKPGVPLGGWGVSVAVAERIRELAK